MSTSTDPGMTDLIAKRISSDTPIDDEPPIKRIRLLSPSELLSKDEAESESQLQKELKAGITAFVSPNTCGFSGVLKQRYTDFLVNEILPNGEVLRLDSMKLGSGAALEGGSRQIQGKSVVATEHLEKEGDSDRATDGVVNGAIKKEEHEHAEQDAEMREHIVAEVLPRVYKNAGGH
jgi:tRNA pseudouridine13 synthase